MLKLISLTWYGILTLITIIALAIILNNYDFKKSVIASRINEINLAIEKLDK